MTLLYSGLSLGAVYALVAFGYNLVYLSSRAFNFAQAQLMMVAAFVAYTTLVTLELPWVVAVVVAMVAMLVVAIVEERIAIHLVRDHHTLLITTLGFATVLDGGAERIWGSEALDVPFPGPVGAWSLFGGRLHTVDLALVLLAVAMVVAAHWYRKRYLSGIAIIGMSQDQEAATLRGIDVRKLALITFAVSGALAGLMGVFVGPKTFALTTLGASMALKGFVALAIGGFGSLYGGLLGGFVVGVVEQVSARYLGAEFSNISVFFVLMLVLLARPHGVFGRVRERVV
jgi:branched-chain amino acid transport system permease protein